MAEEKGTRPLISVAILCYNYGHLLRRALEACGRQTFSDFELIMINNGSSDDTEAVYQDFCATHPEIPTTYVKIEENKGPSFGWREGLKHVTGTYVMFHDADDWMEDHCLEELAKKALETNADRIVGGYQEVQADGTVSRRRKFPKHTAKLPSVMLQGTIFRYSIIVEHDLYFPELTTYDVWFVANYALYENRRAIVHKCIYNYFINPTSWTQKYIETETENHRCEALTNEAIQTLMSVWNASGDSVGIGSELEYWAIRYYYNSILERYVFFRKEAATEYYCRIQKNMKKCFPYYQRNPLLWPIYNGFEWTGSIGCAVLCMLEKMSLINVTSILARGVRYTSVYRKTAV